MEHKLIGKKVVITAKESIYYGEWGIIDSYDGEYFYIRIADGRHDHGHAYPIFQRNEFRVPRVRTETGHRSSY